MISNNHITNILSLVLTQLQSVCVKLNLELHVDDLIWLRDSKGKYLFYVHPKSEKYIKCHNSSKNISKNAVQMKDFFYNKHQQKVGPSPCCKRHVAPNH